MRKNILFVILCLFIFSSCKKSNRFNINTKKNRIEVNINRFDIDFLHLDTANMALSVSNLQKKYPDFYPVFIENIISRNITETDSICADIKNFLQDESFVQVNKDVLETFENTTEIEKSLSEAYTYIHHYFPEIILPEVYFYVSGFYQSIILFPQLIGIGVDMYLGTDYPMYKDVSYQYLAQNMKPESIPVDIVSAILFGNFSFNSEQNRLIDNIIHQGKLFYFLSVFMPNETKENIMGYTKEQWNWCEKHERDIWRKIVDQKDLFSSNGMLIRKYINDAPFTSSISQDSPGRVGTWIGWQIVTSYMNNNADVSLRELLEENNAQKILENSGYR